MYARVYSLCLQYLGYITLLGKAAKQQNDNVIASTKKVSTQGKNDFQLRTAAKNGQKKVRGRCSFGISQTYIASTQETKNRKRVVNLIRSFTSQTNFFSCKYCVSICFNPPCLILENKIKVDRFTIIVYLMFKNLSKLSHCSKLLFLQSRFLF